MDRKQSRERRGRERLRVCRPMRERRAPRFEGDGKGEREKVIQNGSRSWCCTVTTDWVHLHFIRSLTCDMTRISTGFRLPILR
ncbi:hypothetical protein COLO4_21555 [Corchorus olitorius]|uniref:Uncharacterized protein n=1 Tax=Corchorus olitorius TaxID=93759 RepID=A0A1R3ISS8_9ROSI|nr:hypothetical protein COLO4_21555 [Corchorus olitorius]